MFSLCFCWVGASSPPPDQATRYMSPEHREQLRAVADKIVAVAWPPALEVEHFSVADLLGAKAGAKPVAEVAEPDLVDLELVLHDGASGGAFSANWDPSGFANQVGRQGALGRVADTRKRLLEETTPTKVPTKVSGAESGTPSKGKDLVATKAMKVKKAKKATEDSDKGNVKMVREAILAPGIGRLHLSLAENRSELTCTDKDGVRRHIFTLGRDQLVEHAALSCALVRLAASTSMTSEELRAVKDEQLKEARTRRAC
jgi:hypothetical protein